MSSSPEELLALASEHDAERIATEEGIALLRKARDYFKDAGCPKTTEKIRAAIASALGAERSIANRKYRDRRRADKKSASSALQRNIDKIHSTLRGIQRRVFEHTYPGFGVAVFEDPAELGRAIALSREAVIRVRRALVRKMTKQKEG